ncbi:hypothetical protein MTR_2g438270 [Medicago truncatula]|uniref:Reverse transcriptase domain-containing protein n=1 Tax=Medicago truncatula TaxID=3880 RepID=A0A072V6F9_MEDTR|nr:hypothetical protein MTR_2g438270 [Medicago truncatula]
MTDSGGLFRMVSEEEKWQIGESYDCTFIALIHKVENPQGLVDFRPILLIGCLYKVLAKVLANRLRKVIGSVIYESWSAFVKGRQILVD